MPTYDYQCRSCSHRFEHFQSMKDRALRKCPRCGKPALERLIGTGAAVLFKGSGFYQTDYRSESYNAAKKAEAGSGASGDNGAASPAKHQSASAGSGAAASPPAASAPAPPAGKPASEKPAAGRKARR